MSLTRVLDPAPGLRARSREAASRMPWSPSDRTWPIHATARAVVTHLYLPAVVLACVTAWLVVMGVTALRRAGELNSVIAGSRTELAGPVVVGFVLVALSCECLWPAESRTVLARGLVQDGCFFLLFATVMAPFVSILGVASEGLLHHYAPFLAASFAASWPRWLVVGVTLVSMDGCNWLAHVADHRFTSLWRVHALHHSQEELSVLTTFRTHPLVHTVSFVAATVPVVVWMDGRSIAPGLVTLYLCLTALPHANVSWSFGPLGKILVSPAYHRLHHAMDRNGDVNFGIVFVCWDMLARRAVFPERGGTVCRIGIPGRPLPVEQAPRRPRPVLVLALQLVEPFGLPSRPGNAPGAGIAPRPARRHRAKLCQPKTTRRQRT